MDIDINIIVAKYADALTAWGRIYCSDRVWIDGFRWNAQPAEQKKKLKSAEEALKGVEPIFHGSDKEAYDRVMQHIRFYTDFHIQRKRLDNSPLYGAVWLILSIIKDHTGGTLGVSQQAEDTPYPDADIILDILKIIGCPKDILPSPSSIRKLVDAVRDLETHQHYLLMSNPPTPPLKTRHSVFSKHDRPTHCRHDFAALVL